MKIKVKKRKVRKGKKKRQRKCNNKRKVKKCTRDLVLQESEFVHVPCT
jgi:hypothetical protein